MIKIIAVYEPAPTGDLMALRIELLFDNGELVPIGAFHIDAVYIRDKAAQHVHFEGEGAYQNAGTTH